MGINSKWRLGLGIVGFFLLYIWSGILSYLLSASFFRLFTSYFYSSSLQSSQVIFLNSSLSSQSVFSLGSRSGSFYAFSIIFTAFLPSSSPLTSSMLTMLLCNTITSVLCGSWGKSHIYFYIHRLCISIQNSEALDQALFLFSLPGISPLDY